MEDLLESFDPLYASSSRSSSAGTREPLFGGGGSISHGTSSSSSSTAPAAQVNVARGVAVPLRDAPLQASMDLMSLNDEDQQQHMNMTATATRRQEEMLAELQRAEQVTALPPSPRRRSSSGRPPRRLSRSGLMAPFHGNGDTSSSTLDQLPIITHALASPTSLVATSQPSELFHPSSPPEGSSLESLRQQNTPKSYFGSLGRSVGGRLNFGSSTSATSPPSTSQNREAPSFPNIDNSDLFARSTSYSSSQSNRQRSRPQSASSSSIFFPTSPSSSSSATTSKKPSKRSHTFDFPTTSGLSSSSTSGRNTTLPPPHPIASTSRGPSPLHSPASHPSSLAIDSEPLPSLSLKIPAAASGGNRVLTDDIAEGIRPSLSTRLRLCRTWTLLYSLDAHGTSLTTLCARVQAGLLKSAGGCVLCVRDMQGSVFGGYVNEAFVRREGYYGNGECFLWKVDTFPANDSFRVGPLVRSFRWSGSNDYLILSDSPNFLSLGGGNGTFGLWLDSSFDRGFTTTCPTFGNEPLCSEWYWRENNLVEGRKEAKFEIQAVECWAVG